MTFHCNTFSLVWSRDKVENMEKTGKEITKVELNLSHAEMMVLSFALAHRELRLDDILLSCLGRSGDSIIAVDKGIAILSDNDGDYYASCCEASRKELDSLNLLLAKIGQLL